MKKTMALFLVTFAFVLVGCRGSGGIPDGTYTMTGVADGLGIGNTFTVKGNTMTIPIYVTAGVDYTYKIDGKEIKLTAQGATLSYSYEKKENSYIIGGVEYVQGNVSANNADNVQSVQNNEDNPFDKTGDDIVESVEDHEKEPAPHYEPLNLPITMTEQTFFIGGSWNVPELTITADGDLIESEEIIDHDVRSCLTGNVNFSNVYFYIKKDNSLWSWGSNALGSLGDGTGVDQEKPVKILDNVAWIGYTPIYGFCAIKTDKTLWHWGDGQNYAPVMLAENVVKQLYETYFLNSDGTIDGFIYNYSTGERYIDVPVYDVNFEVQYTSVNDYFNLSYIDSNKNLWTRLNIHGDITTTFVAEGVEKVSGVSSIHFIKSDGSLWGYGQNESGQLGDGTKIPERNEPVKIADDVVDVKDYAFLKSNGEVWTWNSDNPTPQNSIDNVVQMGEYQKGLKYIITKDNRILYYIYYSDWAVFGDSDRANDIKELNNVKIPQIVTFP